MFKSEVFKSWTLVLQLGISILVPILMLVAIAYFIESEFKINLMLPFVILGLAVGVRNAYVIQRNYLDMMDKSPKKESELLERHKKSFNK